jgi:hypothetical protein
MNIRITNPIKMFMIVSIFTNVSHEHFYIRKFIRTIHFPIGKVSSFTTFLYRKFLLSLSQITDIQSFGMIS